MMKDRYCWKTNKEDDESDKCICGYSFRKESDKSEDDKKAK